MSVVEWAIKLEKGQRWISFEAFEGKPSLIYTERGRAEITLEHSADLLEYVFSKLEDGFYPQLDVRELSDLPETEETMFIVQFDDEGVSEEKIKAAAEICNAQLEAYHVSYEEGRLVIRDDVPFTSCNLQFGYDSVIHPKKVDEESDHVGFVNDTGCVWNNTLINGRGRLVYRMSLKSELPMIAAYFFGELRDQGVNIDFWTHDKLLSLEPKPYEMFSDQSWYSEASKQIVHVVHKLHHVSNDIDACDSLSAWL